jgi:E3 ubiquitin-protein ligase listerin
MPKPKIQASSSRVVVENTAFGFAKSVSPLSYLAELPDTSTISNPSTVVIFKNLFKKDSTTKTRALEELTSTLSALQKKDEPLEDAIVQVWTSVYPRTSIETSRRVRQLSHVVHAQICTLAGKRIAKYLSDVVGPWLLGTFDSDKVVSAAAQTALNQVFPTSEKRKTLLQRYHSQIISLISSIINEESIQTLSDERIVSVDEATAKYNRVLSAAIGLLSHMIAAMESADVESLAAQYEGLVQDKKLWALCSSDDVSVRRQVHHLLRTCISNAILRQFFKPKILSAYYISKGLESDQRGSAIAFLDTLIDLKDLNVWTSDWNNKKPATVRLRHFMKSGSHGSPPDLYWSKLSRLFQVLPSELFHSPIEVEDLLTALEKGASGKDEPKFSSNISLNAFISILSTLSSHIKDTKSQNELLTKHISLLLESCIGPDSKWNIQAGKYVSDLAKRIYEMPLGNDILIEVIPRLGESMIQNLKTSLPHQAADYQKSQNLISQMAQRWGDLILGMLPLTGTFEILEHSVTSMISESISILKSRNGKPYGAAILISQLCAKGKTLIVYGSTLDKLLQQFFLDDIPGLVLTQSMEPLLNLLKILNHTRNFCLSWKACVDQARTLPWEDETRRKCYVGLISALPEPGAIDYTEVNEIVEDILQSPPFGSPALLANVIDVLPLYQGSEAGIEIVQKVLQRIGSGSKVSTIDGVAFLQDCTQAKVDKILAAGAGDAFLSTLLSWSESADTDLSREAARWLSLLRRHTSRNSPSNIPNTGFAASVIKKELAAATDDSLYVPTLTKLAIDSLEEGKFPLSQLLPDISAWKESLKPFIETMPRLSNFITSSLHGAIFLIEDSKFETAETLYDEHKWSIPFRTAVFVTEIFSQPNVDLETLDSQLLSEVVELLVLTATIANEELTFGEYHLAPNDDEDLTTFVADSFRLLSSWIEKTKNTASGNGAEYPKLTDALGLCLTSLFKASSGNTAVTYRSAVAWHYLIAELVERYGVSGHPVLHGDKSVELMSLRKSAKASPVQAVAYISAYGTSLAKVQTATRWYNEIIADLTGPTALHDRDVALQRLILLHSFIEDQEKEFSSTTATQRLVFFIRGIVSWSNDDSIVPPIIVLSQAILVRLVPLLLDVFGDHWERILAAIETLWRDTPEAWDSANQSNEVLLPLLYESLKLLSVLRKMANDPECNEDLTEALEAHGEDLQHSLLGLLTMERSTDDSQHVPLRIVNDLICRTLESNPVSAVLIDPEKLYPLLAAKSEPVQRTAFNLLHTRIPSFQEELSVEVALGDTKLAKLPDELLSLILDAPPSKENALLAWLGYSVPPDYNEAIPSRIVCYFYSWILVFDHFVNAVSLIYS